jgi:tRNA pseudouridine38-40 synthase
LCQEEIRVTAAGRTDTGVHALGQVVNFYTNCERDEKVFKKGGNALLTDEIRILAAQEVSLEFHSRFHAIARDYAYYISKKPLAVGRQYALLVETPLNLHLMQKACDVLLGQKSFQAFCKSKSAVKHYICNILSAEWTEKDDRTIFSISANRFLHNMVRSIVGSQLQIGMGKLSIEDFERIVIAEDKQYAGPTAPPHGLFLEKVWYEKKEK